MDGKYPPFPHTYQAARRDKKTHQHGNVKSADLKGLVMSGRISVERVVLVLSVAYLVAVIVEIDIGLLPIFPTKRKKKCDNLSAG